MHAPGQVERVWTRRLRWRMRGAWQWPVFVAMFFNLLAVAVVGPLLGVRLRRRRPDLPRLIASDYASTAVLVLICVALLAGGIAHRPAVAAERADLAAVVARTHDYVLRSQPAYSDGLAAIDAMRVEEDLYRSCVPGPDPRRWLCVFVSTDQRPAGVTEDPDRAPNAAYRRHGGFR
jgi:hypothetical protein